MKNTLLQIIFILIFLFISINIAKSSTTYNGDIHLYNLSDINAFSDLEELNGNLYLHFVELDPVVRLPKLKSVHGNIESVWGIRNLYRNVMQILSFPNLQVVEGSIFIANITPQFQQLELPLLNRITQDLKIYGNMPLYNISLPALTSVGGKLEIGARQFMNSINLNLLQSVGKSFQIHAAQKNADKGQLYIVNLNVPNLRNVGGNLSIEGTAMPQLSFPSLESINGDLRISSNYLLGVVAFDSLRTCSGPLWSGGNSNRCSVIFDSNASLVEVRLPAFQESANSSIRISKNRNMLTCNAFSLTTKFSSNCVCETRGDVCGSSPKCKSTSPGVPESCATVSTQWFSTPRWNLLFP